MKWVNFVLLIILLFFILTGCSSDMHVPNRVDEPDSLVDTADEPSRSINDKDEGNEENNEDSVLFVLREEYGFATEWTSIGIVVNTDQGTYTFRHAEWTGETIANYVTLMDCSIIYVHDWFGMEQKTPILHAMEDEAFYQFFYLDINSLDAQNQFYLEQYPGTEVSSTGEINPISMSKINAMMSIAYMESTNAIMTFAPTVGGSTASLNPRDRIDGSF